MRQHSFLLVAITIALLMAAFCAEPAQASDDSGNLSYARIVRLSLVTGDVQIVRPDKSSKWEPAFTNMPVEQGFTLGTNNGRAEIEFEQGSLAWLGENSILQFTELALSDGGRITKITLAQGTATFYAHLAAGESFAVSTPHFDVSTPAKSEFRLDVFSDGGSASVLRGRVSLNSAGVTKDVMKGETLTVDSRAPDLSAVKPNPSPDTWDRWVNTRESVLVNGQNQSLQYTNAPFTYGMADLSMYGNWANYPGCGYGWQPFGMTAGWMPFMSGQWMYYSGFGWTWISSEPWGWTPYHFGGWMNCPGFGWAWMPGNYGFWSPGTVQWVGVGPRIGWIPRPLVQVNSLPTVTPFVLSTKSLGNGGRIEALPTNKVGNDMRLLSTPPLANGHVGSAIAGKGALPAQPAVVTTASNAVTLRSSLAAHSKVAPLPNAPAASKAPPSATVRNAAPPAPRVPASPPPARTYTFTPSQGGQPGSHPSYSPASGSGSSLPSSVPRSAPSSAPAPRPH